MAGEAAAPRPRRLRRWTLRALALGLVALLGGAWWLDRDPSARIVARRGSLQAVVEGPQEETGGQVDQAVRLVSSSGMEVELLVRRPVDRDERPRPTVLLLPGMRTGARATRLVGDTRGVVVAALSYPGEIERIRSGLGALEDLSAARARIVDAPAAALLALEYLRGRPWVDPARVELVGVSLGAPFACIAGALDSRVRRVWALDGGGAPARMIARGLEDEIGSGAARRAVAGLAAWLAHARHLAPERWVGRIAPRPFVMVNAPDDERIPRACVDALYEAAGEPKERVWLPGGHVDAGEAGRVAELCDLVLARVLED